MAREEESPGAAERARQIDLDERKLALDEELRRREMALRENETKRGRVLSPARVSLIGAVLTLMGGIAGAGITAWSTRDIEGRKSLTSLQIEQMKVEGELELERSRQQATEGLERKKFETTLILEAIRTNSRDEAIRNLKFFVSAGFIADPEKKIAALSPESYPSLTEPSKESRTRAVQSTGKLFTKFESQTWACTGTLVAPRYVITVDHCVHPTTLGQSRETEPELLFSIGGIQTSATIAQELPRANVALLRLSEPAPGDLSIQRWNVRDPVEGESVYLAFYGVSETVQLSTCKVGTVLDEGFEYPCDTGPGSSGALVIAVSDDAILGIHHSVRTDPESKIGIAAKMSLALAALDPIIGRAP